jgi:hypothetical protein
MSEEQLQRVFILGSCVSRDALEIVPGHFELASYLARTSLASVGMPPVSDSEVRGKVAGLASPFQRRMLLNDLDKSTLVTIAETAHDILLLDFIDERFNVVLSGSSLFSVSGELEKAGFELGARTVLSPDSDVFLTLWLAGLDRLLSTVDQSKVVLNRAYWAERFPDGSDASSMGWIRRSNATLRRLYDAVERHWRLPCIDYPPELVVADPQHRWGVAPYHYTEAFYRHAVSELERIAGPAGP